jgi:hypothetical protein
MRLFFVVCFGLLIGFGHAWAAGKRFLVSIVPPPLDASEFIGEFNFNVEGATILSACHIPFGWQITAGMYDSNSGVLKGEGGLGGSLISKKNRNFDQLSNLFLIELNPGTEHYKFDGTIEIGRYGADDRRARTVPLTPSLRKLAPAVQCPPAWP